MLLRMTVAIAGPHYVLDPGDEFYFPDDEAVRLVEAGYAVPVAAQAIERAVREPVAERRGKVKRGKDVDSADAPAADAGADNG